MKFSRKTFFDGIREFLKSDKKSLTQGHVNALEFLITNFENEKAWNDYRHIAYAFATIYHETAHTFEPIIERVN